MDMSSPQPPGGGVDYWTMLLGFAGPAAAAAIGHLTRTGQEWVAGVPLNKFSVLVVLPAQVALTTLVSAGLAEYAQFGEMTRLGIAAGMGYLGPESARALLLRYAPPKPPPR